MLKIKIVADESSSVGKIGQEHIESLIAQAAQMKHILEENPCALCTGIPETCGVRIQNTHQTDEIQCTSFDLDPEALDELLEKVNGF